MLVIAANIAITVKWCFQNFVVLVYLYSYIMYYIYIVIKINKLHMLLNISLKMG